MALNHDGGHKPRIGFRRKTGRQVDTKRILDPLRLLNGGEIGAHYFDLLEPNKLSQTFVEVAIGFLPLTII
jgi:hypothetical protein